MTDFDKIRLGITSVALLILFFFILMRYLKKNTKIDTRFIGRTGVFAAISVILYVVPGFQFKVGFFPSFLEIHFDEVPAAIAAFAYGPLSGLAVLLIKTIIKLPMTSSLCVGEFADLIYGAILILPGALIYKKMHNFKGVLIGLSLGFVIQVITAAFFTTWVLVPFYSEVMGIPVMAILSMCAEATNGAVKNLDWDFFLYVGLPFNAFKNIIIVGLTIVLYKFMHRLIDKISFSTSGALN